MMQVVLQVATPSGTGSAARAQPVAASQDV
jgi:hypothetical protein